MSAQDPSWRDAAFEVYRLAWTQVVDHSRKTRNPIVDFYVEELKEALLDLKQATIADEPAQAYQHMAEIQVLLAELRLAGE